MVEKGALVCGVKSYKPEVPYKVHQVQKKTCYRTKVSWMGGGAGRWVGMGGRGFLSCFLFLMVYGVFWLLRFSVFIFSSYFGCWCVHCKSQVLLLCPVSSIILLLTTYRAQL